MAFIKTPWDDHWMYADYIGFFHHALGEKELLDEYRKVSGNSWTPAATTEGRMIDKATGADVAFLQGYSDWLVANVFGSPKDVFGEDATQHGETVH
jgi:hypothetical protein